MVCADWACLAWAVNGERREEKREKTLLTSDCGRHPPLTLDFHWGTRVVISPILQVVRLRLSESRYTGSKWNPGLRTTRMELILEPQPRCCHVILQPQWARWGSGLCIAVIRRFACLVLTEARVELGEQLIGAME